ncbi:MULTISPECIES: DUF6461 domain-containing protein [Streptomyces]|uniref:DUF6461 domain-containing protein n=1 Tax=Streptomyces TaxID=1883 RepID=UPI000A565BB5|nr:MULTISPECIES: DUF6461 domain-containing protein [Streptomyces]MDX2918269.1 DUF6461 domain-containing protein [Streptomyces sp. NE06-03C]MDX3608928.1 DUF6461 domain-containing protein [Streptomyces sp. FL06-04B]MDX3739637.1 DUF6461 domain-containing protein [Streptomyces sp. ID01-15D]
MPATWDIEDYGDFSLTLSRNHSPEQVLAAYGAEPGEARLMSESQCDTGIEVKETGALLRTGKLGSWSFCMESTNPIGFANLILKNLSDGSEAFSLSRTGHSMTVFKYAQYGQFCEWFEPRNHQTVQGGSPHAFFQRIQNMPSDTSAAMASLKVMSEHVGAELTPEILKGPLLTVNITNTDRALLARPVPSFQITSPAGTRSVLGRRLGTIG